MKLYSGMLGMVITCALITIASCKKDSDSDSNNNDNILQKTGLVMSGDQEVPAKSSAANGTVDVTYHKDTHVLNYTITWYSLTGTPTGAHMHGPAAKGVNAGIVYDFFSIFPSTTDGTFSNSVTVDNDKIIEDSLLAGKYYFNIHTATNPGGEIRAQVEF